LDDLDGGIRVDKLLTGIQRRCYEDETIARMVACIGSERFLNDLILSVVFQNGFTQIGRIEMLLCVPPSLFFVSISM
jgi:hypothetical protein